jgi:hypothetical protein
MSSRTGSPPANSAATTGAVAVRAANYYSDNCTYSSTSGTALLFNHAAGTWSTIRGGYCNASVAQQDVAGIYISAGTTGNVGITIDGVTIIGGGQPQGIASFDCTKCTYVNNHVEDR